MVHRHVFDEKRPWNRFFYASMIFIITVGASLEKVMTSRMTFPDFRMSRLRQFTMFSSLLRNTREPSAEFFHLGPRKSAQHAACLHCVRCLPIFVPLHRALGVVEITFCRTQFPVTRAPSKPEETREARRIWAGPFRPIRVQSRIYGSMGQGRNRISLVG